MTVTEDRFTARVDAAWSISGKFTGGQHSFPALAYAGSGRPDSVGGIDERVNVRP